MKKRTHDRFNRVFWVILLFATAAGCVGIIRGAVRAHAPDERSEAVETVYIVYTDEQSHPYASLTYPHLLERAKPQFALTDAERDRIARIVAGQAVNKSLTAQTMIAQVLYNQMLTTGGDIGKTEYAKCARRTPTEATYEAVDAIFVRGEWLLDDTVLWTGDADNPDAWHQTLRLVTTCDGIAFYEEESNG